MKKLAVILLLSFASILTIVSLAGFLGQLSMQCELLSHLRFPLLLASIVGLVLSSLARSPVVRVVGVLAVTLNFVPIAALYLPARFAGSYVSNSHRQSLTVMQINLCGEQNENYAAVIKCISEANPDVIGFSEIPARWLEYLKRHLNKYSHFVADTEYGGIAVFSKLPFSQARIEHYGDWHRPRAIVKLEVGNAGNIDRQTVNLVCAHPSVPNIRPELRNGELELLADELQSLQKNHPTVLIGDLNCTPFSYYFARLLNRSGLVDSEQGFGFQPTWSAFIGPLVAIDHCLVSKNLTVRARRTGPKVGSDHLPVIVTVEVPAKG